MKEFIENAQAFINNSKVYSKKFPTEISAPIIAHFTHSIISNNLNLSKQDLELQAKTFLQEEQLEEIIFCFEDFIVAMVDFTSNYIKNQTETHQMPC